jgi:ClpP class serine protease
MRTVENESQTPTATVPLVHLAQRLFNTPLAIAQEKYEIIRRALEWRLFPEAFAAQAPPTADHATLLQEYKAHSDLPEGSQQRDAGYWVTPDGIGVICIRGTLVKKSSWADATSGLVSYSSLAGQVDGALVDPGVRGILFDINSPGGETHGMFDLADKIYSARGQKPMYAIANDSAMSAAYLLASSADRIFSTRTGGVGSVGVFACHVDQSDADKLMGVKFTYIYAGDKKVDGNPHEPLSSSARKDAQAETDRQYQMFVEAAARNRGASTKAIIDTQAGVFSAAAGIPLLADAVGNFAEVYEALLAKCGIAQAPLTTRAQAPEEPKQGDKPMAELNLDPKNAPGDGKERPTAQRAAEGTETKKTQDPGDDDSDGDEDDMDDKDKKRGKKATPYMNQDEEDNEAKASRNGISKDREIAELCQMSGYPEKALEFMQKNFSLTKVRATLLDLRAAVSNAPDRQTSGFGTVKTTALEQWTEATRQIQTTHRVSLGKATEILMTQNPRLYESYRQEKLDNTASPGTSAARAYSAAVERILMESSGSGIIPQRLLHTNQGDAARM